MHFDDNVRRAVDVYRQAKLERAAFILQRYRGLEAIAEYAAELELALAASDSGDWADDGSDDFEAADDDPEFQEWLVEDNRKRKARNEILNNWKQVVRDDLGKPAMKLFTEYSRRAKTGVSDCMECGAVVKSIMDKLRITRDDFDGMNKSLVEIGAITIKGETSDKIRVAINRK